MKTGHSEKLSSVIVAVMCAALLIMRAAPPACAAEPRDDDESVRKLLVGLDPNGSQARVAVPRLIAVISDDELSDVVRRQTAMMLARIGDPAREAVPILIELRSDKRSDESGVRFWATKSLGLFGSVAAGAVPILSKELADAMHPAGERLLVADVLGQIGTGPAVQSLARELLRPRDSSDSAETQLLEVAIDAIGQAGPEGIVALPALIRTAAHSRPDVRRKACRTIGRLGPRAELSLDPLLERIVLDDDPAVRDAAAAAMARIGPAAVPVLVRLLDSGLPELQWRAAQSLAPIGPRLVSSGPVTSRLVPPARALTGSRPLPLGLIS